MEIHNSKLVYTSLAAKSKEDLECQVGGHNSPSLRSIIYIHTYICIYNIYIYTLNSRRKLCSAISPVRMKQLQAFVYYYFLFLERGDHRFSRFNLKLLCDSLIA